MRINRSGQRPAAAQAALGGVAILSLFAAAVSTAPFTVLVSGACLCLIIFLLWRGDDPPILFLPPLFQWSEVATVPWSTIWKQVPLNELSPYGVDLEASALYGFAGVAALTIGLRVGSRGLKQVRFSADLQAEAQLWVFRDVAAVAFAMIGAGYVFAFTSGIAGPARELFNQASGIKNAGLFVLAYWCLVRESHYRVLAAVAGFEVIFGMTGFFAEFKAPVLTLIVAALSARPRVRGADILIVCSSVVLLLLVAIFWSAVKGEYRLMVNKGSGAQVVDVSISERVEYLANALVSMDGARFSEGVDRLVLRHGYIEFLGLVLQNVPAAVPHEDGELTLAVLGHIFQPRILFPDKPPLPSDTVVMAKFTGLTYTWDENTSISIGHLGELYVDFGFYGGLLSMALIGGLVGFFYRTLRDSERCPWLISAGLCIMVALPVSYFGVAYAKLMGAMVFASLIAIVTQRYVLPLVLPRLLVMTAIGAQRRRAYLPPPSVGP